MKKIMWTVIFCTSFFSYAAETPNKTSSAIRGIDLGDTGTARIPQSALSGSKKTPVIHTMRRNSDPVKFATEENLIPYSRSWSPGRRLEDAHIDAKK